MLAGAEEQEWETFWEYIERRWQLPPKGKSDFPFVKISEVLQCQEGLSFSIHIYYVDLETAMGGKKNTRRPMKCGW